MSRWTICAEYSIRFKTFTSPVFYEIELLHWWTVNKNYELKLWYWYLFCIIGSVEKLVRWIFDEINKCWILNFQIPIFIRGNFQNGYSFPENNRLSHDFITILKIFPVFPVPDTYLDVYKLLFNHVVNNIIIFLSRTSCRLNVTHVFEIEKSYRNVKHERAWAFTRRTARKLVIPRWHSSKINYCRHLKYQSVIHGFVYLGCFRIVENRFYRPMEQSDVSKIIILACVSLAIDSSHKHDARQNNNLWNNT